MDKQQLARIFCEIFDCDEIIRNSPVFLQQPEGTPPPLVSVDLERVALPGEVRNPQRISFCPIAMERVTLNVDPDAIYRVLRRHPQAVRELTEAYTRRAALQLQLALEYGITSDTGIPRARALNQRVNPSLVRSG